MSVQAPAEAPAATAHKRGKKKPPSTMSSAEKWRRRAPLLPALIFTIFITQIPFLLTIAACRRSTGTCSSRAGRSFLGMGNYSSFAGLANYGTVFTDTRLRNAVVNTIVLTASVVILSLLIGLALAVLLDRKFPGRGLARTLLIAPFLVMPVASALLWKPRALQPRLRPAQRRAELDLAAVRRPGGPDRRLGLGLPDAGGHRSTRLAVDALHDADPAGRPAVATR